MDYEKNMDLTVNCNSPKEQQDRAILYLITAQQEVVGGIMGKD